MTTIPSRIADVIERAIPGVSLWILGVLSYGMHRISQHNISTQDASPYGAVGRGVDQVATLLAPVQHEWNALGAWEYALIVCAVLVCCVGVARVYRTSHTNPTV